MPLTLRGTGVERWTVRKIGVVGPGIVGMPMAAVLARAGIREGSDAPAEVIVVQRESPTSGWKVDAINAGRSVIGGVEPALDDVVREAVTAGRLRATHDAGELADADVVLVCTQTDRDGWGPDYGPLYAALDGLCEALRHRPAGNVPLVVFESTLAPSSMATVIRDRFGGHGLHEGRDLLLGNSPNRVMPGRLVERVESSDKIVAGLHPATPELIARLYGRIVTRGTLHRTNALTAEIVKVLENAYRDVRIAFSAEVVRRCDALDVDFFRLRDAVNERLAQRDGASGDPAAVPTGGLLIPTVGVGGHCLPKDGILLWWRAHEAGVDPSRSLILESRRINDESPSYAITRMEALAGGLGGRRAAVLGAAYRADSEDTRNSPGLELARQLCQRGCAVRIHDPYVRADDQNLRRLDLNSAFTGALDEALAGADVAIVTVAHAPYREAEFTGRLGDRGIALFDGCNLLAGGAAPEGVRCAGIGRGRLARAPALVAEVTAAFRAVEIGVANELAVLVRFLNNRFAGSDWERVELDTVRTIASTCVTGCDIAAPGAVAAPPDTFGVGSRLVARAVGGMP